MAGLSKKWHSNNSLLEQITEYSFYLLMLLMCLMFGTTLTRPLPLQLSHLLIFVVFIIFIYARKRRDKKIVMPRFALTFVFLALFSLFQAVPLPPFLLEIVSPTTAGLYHAMLDSIDMYGKGQWMPLSLEPVASINSAGQWMILWAVFVLATNLFAHGAIRKRFSLSLSTIGLLLTFIGLLHKLSGTEKIFFVFPFGETVPFFFSSFVNPNNFAGFLCLCAPIWLGFTLHSKSMDKKLLGTLAFVITSTAIILTLSLGGTLAWLSGMVLFAILYTKRKQTPATNSVLWLQLAGVLALLAGAYVSADAILQKISGRLATTHQNRLLIWQDCIEMIKDHPLVGVGANAYESAFHRYQHYILQGKVVYPENMLIQYLAEYGLIVTAVFVIAISMVLFRLLISRLRSSEIAFLVAVVSVIISNQFDFNLNQLAVSVPFTAMLGILIRRRTEAYKTSPGFKNFLFLPLNFSSCSFATLVILMLLSSIVGVNYWANNRIEEARKTVYRLANTPGIDEEEFTSQAYQLIARHPSDRYLRVLVSEFYKNDSRASSLYKLRHLQKAARLAPRDSLTYKLIGRTYASLKMKKEAVKNYRIALENKWKFHSAEDIFRDMGKSGLNINEIIQATPYSRITELARMLWQNKKHQALSKLLENWPQSTASDKADLCEWKIRLKLRTNALKEAEQLANKLVDEFPADHRGYLLLAESYKLQQNYAAAEKYYRKAMKHGASCINTNLALAQILYDTSKLEEARIATNKAWANHNSDKKLQRDILLMFARISLKEGDSIHAKQDSMRAIKLFPKHWPAHQMLGMVYESQRKWQTAAEQYKKTIKLARREQNIEAVKILKKRLAKVESYIHDIPRYNPQNKNTQQ